MDQSLLSATPTTQSQAMPPIVGSEEAINTPIVVDFLESDIRDDPACQSPPLRGTQPNEVGLINPSIDPSLPSTEGTTTSQVSAPMDDPAIGNTDAIVQSVTPPLVTPSTDGDNVDSNINLAEDTQPAIISIIPDDTDVDLRDVTTQSLSSEPADTRAFFQFQTILTTWPNPPFSK